jgi:protein involved in polysaccharide export with SLBB domain
MNDTTTTPRLGARRIDLKLAYVAGAIAAILLGGCSQRVDVVPTHVDGFAPWSAEPEAHRLGAGDELDLRFTLNPELNERVTIAPEGQLTVPLLGAVDAAGETLGAFTAMLRQRYASVLRVAEVDVLIHAYGSERVFVGGEVRSPGMLTISGPTDVLQSVMMAGGLLPTARMDEVVVIRRRPDRMPMLRTVNLKALISTGAPSEDLKLQPYDLVYVPRSGIADFNLFIDQYLNQAIPFSKDINANIGSGTFIK